MKIVAGLGSGVHYIAGLIIAVLFMIVGPILTLLILAGAFVGNEGDKPIVLSGVVCFLLLPSLIYSNLFLLFSRLKKEDRALYDRATNNKPYFVAVCSREGGWRFHQWAKDISKETFNNISNSMRLHAKFTKYLNYSWFLSLLLVFFVLLIKETT